MYTIPITFQSIITANFLASLRLPYEYRRGGYDYQELSDPAFYINNFFHYNFITTPSNIALGILSELLLYQDLTQYLLSQTNNLINEKFECNLGIGAYDGGYDFIKNNQKIDAKCYATKTFSDIDEISKFNLLVDELQYDNHKADIYIQTFILHDASGLQLVVAGYAYSQELKLNKKFPQPAYCLPVRSLYSYDKLKLKYFRASITL